MNCANHPDRERSAFCQNCGKPLCAECIRRSGNSIFCEPCLFARTASAPVGGVYPPPGGVYPPPGGGPNPGLAALLGFIPGVGAMYNGQYAKGIVHLMVFAVLVSLANENGIFGLFIAGWIFYMVIEAHHTARARRDGAPLPNPFGLNDLSERLGFGRAWPGAGPGAGPVAPGAVPPYTSVDPAAAAGVPPGAGVPPPGAYAQPPYNAPYSYTYVPPVTNWGAPQEGYGYGAVPVPPVAAVPPVDPAQPVARRVPAGAIWLIVLGVLFLFGNTGVFLIRARFVGPLVLIAVGVWVFVRRMTYTGQGIENDGTPAYTWRLARAARHSIWLVVTGFVWLLDVVDIVPWSRSWPIFLIVGGLLLLLRRTMFAGGPGGYPPSGYGYPPYPVTPVTPAPAPVPTTEMVPSNPQSISEEGR